MKVPLFLLIAATTLFSLGACGKAPEEVALVEESVDSAEQAKSPAPVAAEATVPDRDVEKEINDLFLEESGEEKALAELMMDPQIQELMAGLFENWDAEPAHVEAMMHKLMGAMQSLTAAGLTPGVESPKTNQELDNYLGEVSVGINDPDQVRELLGYLILEDPEGFINSFARMVEEAAIEEVIDPGADTGVKVQVLSEGSEQ